MKIGIIGFGTEGEAAFKYWKNQGAEIVVHDQDPNKELPKGAKAVLGPDAYASLDEGGYDFLVRSPGNRLEGARITTPIISSTIEFFKVCPAPIVGVTGTKGKGTTSSLIAEFLKAAGKTVHLVGNIGEPCLDALPSIKASDWVVFELSSFQLFDMHQSPHVAVHLMFEPDHQDWHRSMDEYADAKANVFRYQTPDDIAVYFAGSVKAQEAVRFSEASTKVPYDRNLESDQGVRVYDGQVWYYDQPVAATSVIKLVGEHMLDNVCAAVAATVPILLGSDKLTSLDTQVFEKVLKDFKGLPHRVQLVAEVDGVSYVDDSYSATPSAARAGLKAFAEPKIAILGGHDKSADFAELAQTVKDSNVRHALVIGVTAPKIIEALDQAQFSDYSTGYKTMPQIVTKAAELAKPGDVVLLSPGCASFDMFKNFTDRGEQFDACVLKLKKA